MIQADPDYISRCVEGTEAETEIEDNIKVRWITAAARCLPSVPHTLISSCQSRAARTKVLVGRSKEGEEASCAGKAALA